MLRGANFDLRCLVFTGQAKKSSLMFRVEVLSQISLSTLGETHLPGNLLRKPLVVRTRRKRRRPSGRREKFDKPRDSIATKAAPRLLRACRLHSLTVSRAKPLRRRPKTRLDICHRATNPGSDRCSVGRITFSPLPSAALERSSTLPPPVVTGAENPMILPSGAFCSVH